MFGLNFGAVVVAVMAVSVPVLTLFYFEVVRKFEQNYFLKQELKIMILILCYWLLFSALSFIEPVQRFYDTRFNLDLLLGMMLPLYVAVSMVVWYPFVISRKRGYFSISRYVKSSRHSSHGANGRTGATSRNAAGIKGMTLVEIMNDPDISIALKEFLARDFAVENILFLEQVSAFQALPEASNKTLATQIFNKFISPNALMSINISMQAQLEVKDAIETNNLKPHTFDTAESDVRRLVTQSVLPRFFRFYSELLTTSSLVSAATTV